MLFQRWTFSCLRHVCALVLWMGVSTMGLWAQTGADSLGRVSAGEVDPYYLQLYAGINKSANEHLPWSEFSRHPWSGGLFVGVGKEFNPLWGWRAAFGYNHNKSRNVPFCESPETWGWDNVELFADMTFDVTDALGGLLMRPAGRFNLKAFAGVGGAYTFGFPEDVPLSYTYEYAKDSIFSGAFRAGLTATYQVADRWRVGAELSHTLFTDRFNGVKGGFPFDGRTNLKVGVTYLLAQAVKRKPVVSAPVRYDHRLRVVPPLPFLMPAEEEVKVRQLVGRAFLDFPVNETTINPQYRRNPEELARICASIDSALFDKEIEVMRISLHGYASPESPYANNTRLAKGRTESLKQYISAHYALADTLFQTAFTPEDWQNLRAFIEAGNRQTVKDDIWYAQASVSETPVMPDFLLRYREELLQVIDQEIDPDEKEAQLKRVGDGVPYQWLLRHVYPGLRHTDYVIEYVVGAYPVKDGRKLIYTHPEALSLREMYQVAQSYPEGSDDWLDALLIAAKQFPDEEEANLNAACACVRVKRLTDARYYISKAGDTEEADYVGRVIRAMEGTGGWHMEAGKIIID